MPYNQNFTLVDGLDIIGVLSSIGIGVGGAMVSTITNCDIKAIETPIKILAKSSTALGGVVSGGIIGGILGMITGTMGAAVHKQEASEIKIKNLVFAASSISGAIIGGLVANEFRGEINAQLSCDIAEIIIDNIQASAIIETTIMAVASVGCYYGIKNWLDIDNIREADHDQNYNVEIIGQDFD
ncbi:MAG: hypothetical protein EKK61_02295 [Rickettsiales bacterium]|nr:MAG: hypothetical protein EKK61_02295 [Rickettsiales bacterium]